MAHVQRLLEDLYRQYPRQGHGNHSACQIYQRTKQMATSTIISRRTEGHKTICCAGFTMLARKSRWNGRRDNHPGRPQHWQGRCKQWRVEEITTWMQMGTLHNQLTCPWMVDIEYINNHIKQRIQMLHDNGWSTLQARLTQILFPIVWWCCIFSSGVGWKQRRVVSNLRRHDDISDRQSFEDKWTRKAWANHNPHEGKEYLRRRIPWLQCKKRCLHENPYQVDEAIMAMKVKYATAPMIWKAMQPKAIFLCHANS